MEVTGKIIVKLPLQSGTAKATGNPWTKQEYVLETMDAFPKKIHFDFFGEKANQFPLEVGQIIKLSFDIESREYNGRWYTSIRGWKSEDASQVPAQGAPAGAPIAAAPVASPAYQAAPAAAPAPGMDAAPANDFGGGTVDDLPF